MDKVSSESKKKSKSSMKAAQIYIIPRSSDCCLILFAASFYLPIPFSPSPVWTADRLFL
jgi:hypothetical protein